MKKEDRKKRDCRCHTHTSRIASILSCVDCRLGGASVGDDLAPCCLCCWVAVEEVLLRPRDEEEVVLLGGRRSDMVGQRTREAAPPSPQKVNKNVFFDEKGFGRGWLDRSFRSRH